MDTGRDALRKLKAIRQRRKDIKQDALARRIGASQSTISRWLSKDPGSLPNRDNVAAIAEMFEEMFPDEVSERKAKNNGWEERQDQPDGDVENLTIISGAGGGGLLYVEYRDDGFLADPAMSDGYWSFPESIKAGWRNLPRVKSFPVVGDSMEPTLVQGSTVFVDMTHTYPSPEDIYALDYGDGLVIKRLKLVPGSDKILVISDNSRYGAPDELLRQDVRVYGRVVAWFQWRG